jgi:RNA 2',3'-cyclic 3'-phosphodiesterase
MSEPSLRLFLGVGVPDLQLRALEAATEGLRRDVGGARWVARENQHVTIKFLGWTPPPVLDAVLAAARAAVAGLGPWRTSLTHLGAFPSARRARVLWAALEDPDATMAALAGAVDKLTEPLGFVAEKRAYTPHLTLARLRPPARLPELPELSAPVCAPFTVDDLRLYRSHLSPRGARYEVLERISFGGEPRS